MPGTSRLPPASSLNNAALYWHWLLKRNPKDTADALPFMELKHKTAVPEFTSKDLQVSDAMEG